MTIISCITKFHAFALAEQLDKRNLLSSFYTSFAYQKNSFFRLFTNRIDKEQINRSYIQTRIPIAIGSKLYNNDFFWMEKFDQWVSNKLKQEKNYSTFIGWSGMSLHAIRQAKNEGKVTILERGSSHILYQNKILNEEYRKFGINYQINRSVIKKELKEYEEADYIAVPSLFVKNSFIEYGIDHKKLFHNPYGVSSYFAKQENSNLSKTNCFRILYLGSTTIRKGLIYLYEALNSLKIPKNQYEVWFIGSVAEEMKLTIKQYQQVNWKFFGHINHYELAKFISSCDIAIQPSIEEGLSMVIAQILSCGIPIIATTNSGAQDIIDDGVNGFIIPIRSANDIKEKIEYLFNNKEKLNGMKISAKNTKNIMWIDYGNRYSNFLEKIVKY